MENGRDSLTRYLFTNGKFTRNVRFSLLKTKRNLLDIRSLQGKIAVVTMVWVLSRFRLRAPPDISSSCLSPLISSGQRSRASWASEPQKSATLSPQPGGKPRKFIRTCDGIGGIYIYIYESVRTAL